jgi:hypothetical protein
MRSCHKKKKKKKKKKERNMNQNNYFFFQLTDFQRLKIMKKKNKQCLGMLGNWHLSDWLEWLGLFWRWDFVNCFPGLAQTMTFLISAS